MFRDRRVTALAGSGTSPARNASPPLARFDAAGRPAWLCRDPHATRVASCVRGPSTASPGAACHYSVRADAMARQRRPIRPGRAPLRHSASTTSFRGVQWEATVGTLWRVTRARQETPRPEGSVVWLLVAAFCGTQLGTARVALVAPGWRRLQRGCSRRRHRRHPRLRSRLHVLRHRNHYQLTPVLKARTHSG